MEIPQALIDKYELGVGLEDEEEEEEGPKENEEKDNTENNLTINANSSPQEWATSFKSY